MMVIDGTYLVSGKYAVHVEFDEDLAWLEYRDAVEDLKNVGAGVIPHERGRSNNGDLQVLKFYEGIIEDLDLAQWDLENSEKDSEEWIEASEAVKGFKNDLEDYLALEWNHYTIIIDRSVYKKCCGSDLDEEAAQALLDRYVAFANNECVHLAVIPLNGEGLEDWEDRITGLDYCELDEMGGTVIPIPESCLLDYKVIKILNEHGYHVGESAKFLEVLS